MSYIFIGYSKKNRTYAYKLADFLQERGFNVWIDKVGIEYGVDWWDAILEGLDGCGAMVVIMTPESKESSWVKREVFLAINRKKPVFPLLLNGDNWEIFVSNQYIDVKDSSMPDENLLQRLSHHAPPSKKSTGENKSNLTPEKQSQQPRPSKPNFDIDQAIIAFGTVYQDKKWTLALELLGRICASAQDPTLFDPDEFEQRVQDEIEAEQYVGERDRQYNHILAMMSYANAETVWATLARLWVNFPAHDPNSIAEKVRPQPKIILPEPFEWIDIPSGRILLTDNMGTFDVAPFTISKYPITVAQYTLFVDDKGYDEEHYWTPASWSWRRKENITLPNFWEDKNFHRTDHPIVGASWYEAMAFCSWLGEKLGQDIRLPTEQQWQWAAQGDTGWAYPWGPEFDEKRCNFNSRGTTPVTQYPNGKSPFEVMDMSGNVWEWCLTEHSTANNKDIYHTNIRVLRGGSWGDLNPVFLCIDDRDGDYPNIKDYDRGFRVVRSF
jgi:hypothetical protein